MTASHAPASRWIGTAVIALLLVHAVLSLFAMRDASATFDEVLHIASGLSYWTTNDYRLQPENGNLPQRWCALPLFIMGYELPADERLWRASDGAGLGQQLLYGGKYAPAGLLLAARTMSVVWSTALCLVIFLWSRSLFGSGGGLVSLGLAAFWPALVAHGPLATSDACGALFFTLATWCLWNVFHLMTPATMAAACVAVGLAAVAKHSSVLLAPLSLLLLGISACGRPPLRIRFENHRVDERRWSRKLGLGIPVLAAAAVAAAATIWLSCGLRYRAGHPDADSFRFLTYSTLEMANASAGRVGQLGQILGDWRLVPESWLYGLAHVVARSRGRYAFALGAHSFIGWWWFFPLCLAVKNTLPAILLSAGGIGLWAARCIGSIVRRCPLDPSTYGSLPLVATLLVLWPTFLTSHLNIGERHLLPSYPPLMILAGGLWRHSTVAWQRTLIVALLGLHAADVTARWPATLAYFNQIVPRGHEYRWLVDSSLDWGQDLNRLARWLERERRPREPVYITSFGGAPIQSAVTDFEFLGSAPRAGELQRLAPGLYCVSASALQGVGDVPRGPWCRSFETAWQMVAAYVAAHATSPDETTAQEIIDTITVDRDEAKLLTIRVPTAHDRVICAFNMLRASRLKSFLRHRAPDASIGGSILVWRLSQPEIDAAVDGPPTELAEQSWFEREGYGTSDELLTIGRRRLAAGDAAGARDTFGSMTVFYPGDPRAWRGLADARDALGQAREAEHARREAERLRNLLRRSAGAL